MLLLLTYVIFQEHTRSPTVVVPYPTHEPSIYQLQSRLVSTEEILRFDLLHISLQALGFFIQCSASIPLKWYSHSVNRNVAY